MVLARLFMFFIHLTALISVYLQEVGMQLYSFACGNPVFPALSVEEIFFPPIDGLDAFVRSQFTICVRVYF